jgi:glucose-1-phosphate thymidylyltransferase short form
VITTPDDQANFKRLLGDGIQLGIHISYEVQPHPGGLAQAFIIGKGFIGKERTALVLGDNIFYGHGMQNYLRRAVDRKLGAMVFAYRVVDPQRYGVVEFASDGRAIALEEKPTEPLSQYAVVVIYFYDNQVVDIAALLTRRAMRVYGRTAPISTDPRPLSSHSQALQTRQRSRMRHSTLGPHRTLSLPELQSRSHPNHPACSCLAQVS